MPPLIDLLKRIREFFVKNSDPFAHPFPVCTPKLEYVGISNLTFDYRLLLLLELLVSFKLDGFNLSLKLPVSLGIKPVSFCFDMIRRASELVYFAFHFDRALLSKFFDLSVIGQ